MKTFLMFIQRVAFKVVGLNWIWSADQKNNPVPPVPVYLVEEKKIKHHAVHRGIRVRKP